MISFTVRLYNAARKGHDGALCVQLFAVQLPETVQNPAHGVFFAEVVREQGDSGVQKIAGFDHAILDDLVQGVAFGESLKHGHKVVHMGGLGVQLDPRLLVLFPIFHDNAPAGRRPGNALRLNG